MSEQIIVYQHLSMASEFKNIPTPKVAPNLLAAKAQATFQQALAFHQKGQLPQAKALYEEILITQPEHFDSLHLLGVIAHQTKNYQRAVDLIGKAIELYPKDAAFYYNRGLALQELKQLDAAVASYDKAIVLKPDFAMAHNNRGNALLGLKRPADALASYDRAIALKPDYARAYSNRGKALANLRRYEEAFAAYDKAFALEPDMIGVEGGRLNVKMRICDWSNIDSACAHLISSVRNGKIKSPFYFLAIPSSSDDQLQCAKLLVANKFPPSQKPIWQGERYDHSRIRVAYLSPDFREHALSSLTAGMFECHDKSYFDITAISFGPDDNSEMRQRLRASFEHFIDARMHDDDQMANLLKEFEIDILVDLTGFTDGSRTGVFAKRPAPIQVNYLGYPGTMGAQYIDYIIADRIVIPERQREFYSEKVVFLPNSYQVNDAKRSIGNKTFTRIELGLPLMGFVFCCFNSNYKIMPHIFDCWMRILKQVEGSVLWLLEDNVTAANNLRKEAVARGVDAERLIFAKHRPPSDHLARHRLADLFLDTLPVNAHTTASDALWAGLPLLTCRGETFPGRVAASLLNAIGLPELITTTLESYEQVAIDLATHPEKLATVKRKLADNRLTTPLFNTKLFTKHIEAAYTAMYERYQTGLPPDHIIVPN
jgi:protein O-GlcNAc transferase